jgi:tubulin-specific chaperone A
MAPSQLEIKTKALGRLVKEEGLYQKEVKEQEQVVEKLKAVNGDEYDIKKQIEVLNDTKQMVPEIRQKIKQSLDALEAYLESYTGSEDVSAANENIDVAKKLFV